MRTLGLLGGMSWESTVSYYQTINRIVGQSLGGVHSARLLLHSVDFADIETLQRSGQWDEAGALLAAAAVKLQAAGAEGLVICANTMHKVAPIIEAAIDIPLLHIADCTAAAVAQAGLVKLGLLGTRYTMEQDFLHKPLRENGLQILVPDEDGRDVVHRIIYDELVKGIIEPTSRAIYQQEIATLTLQGAEGIILGCTEIGLLLTQADSALPLFDTAQLHAEYAARWMLREVSAPATAI